VTELSGVRHPLIVLPAGAAAWARELQALDLPGLLSPEGIALMAQDWRCSSAKARRELGYRSRPLDRTLRDTIDWYRDLIEAGLLGGGEPSALSLPAAGLRLAGRAGLLAGLRAAGDRLGRRLVVGG
jgi:hypothetical protein